MTEALRVLVAGVTGQQGGAVARALLERGHSVVGLTRNPEKAQAWRSQGVEIVRGDLTDPASLRSSLRQVQGFFIMTTPFERGPDEEVRQGTTAVRAAKDASVDYVVLSSVASADRGTGLPHFESKAEVERFLREAKLPATTVRPVAFMENFLSPWTAPALGSGTLSFPVKPTTAVQHIAVRDHGAFVASRFSKPEEAVGETVEIAGDAKTMPQVAAMLTEKLGHPVRYVEIPDEQARAFLGEEGVAMNRWFDREGYRVDIPALERRWNIRMTRFPDFFRAAEWPPKNIPP